MAPVARELSRLGGVLEPLQTARTIPGQIEELKAVATDKGKPPLVLIGWSWGAWLSFILAARFPTLVKKLILVASGPFEDRYAENIMKTRLSRLSEKDSAEVLLLMHALEKPATADSSMDKDAALMRLGKLMTKADSFDPVPHKSFVLECQYDTFQSVWRQAVALRSSGKLKEYAKDIRCPVMAIHGDYDPHPAEGVRRPLAKILKDFRFVLLEKCGHTPWIEKAAKDKFYGVIRREMG
jgi:pimeloyl-ACP methyl ester carboxylesterase